ncbi:uncharacterized protein LOC121239729 isoform X2 [Juglans microcarpa x Juglans regia]|uniref:uncharacterized protein LOC121239729 isoform X2 n=1 Tax=Juglans microcarpa x Juglans regia TaxID=2249226 RepID=UPI001B7F6672|nr:uncharacterized protein LOC121239729 isoform X2 [Juglans microcarpa x Juglans regia]
MEGDKPTTLMCTLLAIDHTSFCYNVCSVCERTLPDIQSLCKFCNFNNSNPCSSSSKRLFRVLISIASDTNVFTVICFDRAAKVLFGCSANEFFDFTELHPFAGNSILERNLQGLLKTSTLRSLVGKHITTSTLGHPF